jgi:hypothetical protein
MGKVRKIYVGEGYHGTSGSAAGRGAALADRNSLYELSAGNE